MTDVQEWMVGEQVLHPPPRHLGVAGVFLGVKYDKTAYAHPQAIQNARRVIHGWKEVEKGNAMPKTLRKTVQRGQNKLADKVRKIFTLYLETISA